MAKLAKQRILVTGGTGFIGNRLVKKLSYCGYDVRCLARQKSNTERLAGLNVELIIGDILELKTVRHAMENVDFVFNLVGGGNVSTISKRGLTKLRELNVSPLQNILDVAKNNAVEKIIHFSSISAMGVQKNVVLNEESECKPQIPHEIVKLESERIGLTYFKNYNVPTVILRPSQVYGPGDTRSEILKIAKLVQKGLFPLIGGGNSYMPWVYVDDVVDCTVNAMLYGRPGEIYIVSGAESYTLKDIVSEIAANIPTSNHGLNVPMKLAKPLISMIEQISLTVRIEPLFTNYRLESSTSNRFVSIDKAKRELHYVPKVDLKIGMRKTVEWYKKGGYI